MHVHYMDLISPIGLVSFIDLLHQKLQKPDVGSCQSTKIDTFLCQRYLKSLTAAFSQIFPVTPSFFKILTIGTNRSIIPKSEGVPDVRD